MQNNLILILALFSVVACSDSSTRDAEVYTLYSTNFPNDLGRHPVATFDVAGTPELSLSICQETADLYQADFEKRKRENSGSTLWANAKSRYWCEKGRFKKLSRKID